MAGVKFTRESAQRIAAATRKVEGQQTQPLRLRTDLRMVELVLCRAEADDVYVATDTGEFSVVSPADDSGDTIKAYIRTGIVYPSDSVILAYVATSIYYDDDEDIQREVNFEVINPTLSFLGKTTEAISQFDSGTVNVYHGGPPIDTTIEVDVAFYGSDAGDDKWCICTWTNTGWQGFVEC